MRALTHLDLDQNQLVSAVIENRSSAPSSPEPGQVYFDTTENVGKIWNGSQWDNISGGAGGSIEAGVIVMWSGAIVNIPSGWALCDGTDGTPDLRDRFIVGAGGEYNPEDTGGADEVALTAGEMPSHSHGSGSLSSATTGSHNHSVSTTTDSSNHSHIAGTLGADSIFHSHGSGSLGTGSNGSHGHNNTGGTSTSHTAHNSNHRIAGQPHSLSSTFTNSGAIHSAGSHSHSVSGSVSSTSHTHDVSGSTGSHSHSHGVSTNTGSNGNHSHSISGDTGSVGSGDAHENRPPYFALAFIMKL